MILFKLFIFLLNVVKLYEKKYITNRVSDNLIDPTVRAIEKFETHPSVLIFKNNISKGNKFSFTEVSQSEIEKEIKNLNAKKSYNPQKYTTENVKN